MIPERENMQAVSQRRCFHHALREAAARCPICRRYFCRECVTEHAGRVICASCLRKTAEKAGRKGGALAKWARGAALVGVTAMTFTMAWFCFYSLGAWLLRQPVMFHEGTLWK